eukprot:PhF_6_TR14228/c0_g1_i1/m.22816/K12739/PPIL6; peptidyl-prolyl cis-trans isomerase-like 6
MVPVDWEKYLEQLTLPEAIASDLPNVAKKCIVMKKDPATKLVIQQVWTAEQFIYFCITSFGFRLFHVDPADEESYESRAAARYSKFLRSRGNYYCKLVIQIVDGKEKHEEHLVFELYTNTCPLTVENFRFLCSSKTELSYKGCFITRIVNGGFIQGGDVSNKTEKGGNSGKSIYGPKLLDECFDIKHDREGIIGMANDGPHTAASQFYVTLGPSRWMDGRYVAFGRIIEGLSMLRKMGNLPTKPNQAPNASVKIVDCNEIVV